MRGCHSPIVLSSTRNSIIRGNVFCNSFWAAIGFLYPENNDALIADNVIVGNQRFGVSLFDVQNSQIFDNVISCTDDDLTWGIASYCDDYFCDNGVSEGLTIYSNTVTGCDYGISIINFDNGLVESNTMDNVFKCRTGSFNIFVNNECAGIESVDCDPVPTCIKRIVEPTPPDE